MPQSSQSQIRQALLTEGRRLFARSGLKGTTVRHLTSSVGISDGSLYSVVNSKEELFFEVLESEEKDIAEQAVDHLKQRELTREHLSSVIAWTLSELQNNLILRTLLDPAEYRRVLRKIPPERLADHQASEREMLGSAIRGLQEQGLLVQIAPTEVQGLIHALFLVTLHEDEIGSEVFPSILARLIRLVADSLATKGERLDLQ